MKKSGLLPYGMCPYPCKNKSPQGYCKTTGCTNPQYNSLGTELVKQTDRQGTINAFQTLVALALSNEQKTITIPLDLAGDILDIIGG